MGVSQHGVFLPKGNFNRKKCNFNRENDDKPGNFGVFYFETSPYMPI
jgi:hypothetical protein